ncbi:hypothetical protein CPB84DRAFT_355279 [Gymnopilus junonius]|uniref:BTB domain-containing protein n=1 Tax=Gymnopilus junonius TaxID=109634 RepID=A0A9P5TGF6_GYMJU|nr:hypothetical protein CPB84DRAFT_355279 [Gymnopilus junonius]
MVDFLCYPLHTDFSLALVNSSNADITIQSSDNVLFRLHRQNLAVTTGAFPGSEFVSTPEEVVHLTEPAKVLEVVFQFVYPRRDMVMLEDIDFKTLLAIAEAMEKYEVFLGIKTCTEQLSKFLPSHPTEVIAHAVKHDLVQLIDEAALLLARSPLLETLRILPPHCIFPWVRCRKGII